jgi:hypothetical protein
MQDAFVSLLRKCLAEKEGFELTVRIRPKKVAISPSVLRGNFSRIPLNSDETCEQAFYQQPANRTDKA